MDETAVWADMVANTTVDDIGTRSVSLKATGHEKLGCPFVFLQRQIVQSLNRWLYFVVLNENEKLSLKNLKVAVL